MTFVAAVCFASIACIGLGLASGVEIANAAAVGPFSTLTVSSAKPNSNTGKRCPRVKPSETQEGPAPEAVAPVALSSNARDLVLCRYWSLEAGRKAERLASVHFLRSRFLVGSIIEELNALQPAVQGEHTCPNDSGAFAIGLLDYAKRTVKLTFGLSGCREVAIGDHEGGRFMSPVFLHRIARLSRP